MTESVIDTAAKQTGFWAEHGLPGLVIFALFVLLGFVFWYSTKVVKENGETFAKEVKCAREDAVVCRQMHQEERREWTATAEKQSDKLEAAFKDLTSAIREKRIG